MPTSTILNQAFSTLLAPTPVQIGPGAADSTLIGSGNSFNDAWIDGTATAYVDTAGLLNVPYNGTAYTAKGIQRPPNETTKNQSATWYYVQNGSRTVGPLVRCQPLPTSGNVSGYWADIHTSSVTLYKVQNGAVSGVTSGGAAVSYTAPADGTPLVAVFSAVDNGSGGTTLTATVATQASPGTILATCSGTDTTAALQGGGTIGLLSTFSTQISRVVYNITDTIAAISFPTPVVTGNKTQITISMAATGGVVPLKYTRYQSASPFGFHTDAGVTTPVINGPAVQTDTPPAAGSYKYYNLVATDAAGTIAESPFINSAASLDTIANIQTGVWGDPLNVVQVGDSITYNSNPKRFALNLQAALSFPVRNVTVANLGVSSTTSADWQKGGSYYSGIIPKLVAGVPNLISLALGTNDGRDSLSTSSFVTNMQTLLANIVADATTAGIATLAIVVHRLPRDFITSSSEGSNVAIMDALIPSLTLPANTFIGKTNIQAITANRADLYIDGVHPTIDTTTALQGDAVGETFLETLWIADIVSLSAVNPNVPVGVAQTGDAYAAITTLAGTVAMAGSKMDLIDSPNANALVALSTAIQSGIINETDGQAVLAAIVAKINSTDVNLAGLSVSAIAAAVWQIARSSPTSGSFGEVLATINGKLPAGAIGDATAANQTALAGYVSGVASTQTSQGSTLAALAAVKPDNKPIVGSDGTTLVASTVPGDSKILVNHNTGGTDHLRVAVLGVPESGAVIRAYLAADYAANAITAAVQDRAITGDDGRWLAPMYLLPGSYTLVVTLANNFGVTIAVTVA